MAPRQHRKSKLDPYIEKVGVFPDAEVAALAGVTVDNVRAYRRRRGIPAGWRGETAEQPAPEEAAEVTVAPEPKRATKKRKASKPKAKKPAAKAPRAKKPEAEPTPEVEQVEVAVLEVEPEADAAPAPAEVPPPDPEQPVEAEAAMAPAPVPPRAAKRKRKAAKPKAKKAAAKTPRAKKPMAVPAPAPGPEVTPIAAVLVEEEPEVEALPAPAEEPPPEPEQIMEPEVVAEPADDLPAAPAPRARPIRQHRRSKLDAYLDKLGLIPDAQVASLAGVTPENVRVYRVRRGIPARWRGEGDAAPVESVPFPKATAKPAKGKASSTRRARRGKLTPFMDQIGIVPDARIAELSGTTPANVRAYRLRHDIPARWRGEGEPLPSAPAALVLIPSLAEAPAPGTAQTVRKPRMGKLTPYLEEIGFLADKVIAAKAGTTTQNVRAFRLRHEIPARWRGEGEPLASEEAAVMPAVVEVPAIPATQAEELPAEVEEVATQVAPAGATLPEAYMVTVEGPAGAVEYAAVGADIVDAAATAVAGMARAGITGKVVAVRFLATVLGG